MSNENGTDITNVFKYVQKVFKECQQLIYKTDNLMAPEWKSIYGTRITRDVTSSLIDPEKWLVEAIFRVYENEQIQDVSKAITITFWGEDVTEPVITAGKIVYNDSNKKSHWDLWNIWFSWIDENEDNQYVLDGKINNFYSKDCEHIKEAQVFSYPLVSIENDIELKKKIVDVLLSL